VIAQVVDLTQPDCKQIKQW